MPPRAHLRRLVPAALSLALLAGGCSRSAASAAEEGTAPARRVVSLTPAVCQMVDALGRRAWLVGATTHCDVEGVPRIGDMRPDAERILGQRPDLVVAARYPFNAPDLEALRAQGLSVLDVPLTTLSDLRAALTTLGERLDARPAGERLVGELDAALAEARTAAARRTGAPLKVLLVFDVSGGHVYTTGGNDHLAEVLAATGAQNVAAGGPVTARLPLERVVALAPDVIVHTATTTTLPDDAAARAFWARMPTLPAVQAGRIHVWPDGHLAQPGPRLAGAIRRLTTLLAAAP